MRRFIRRGRSPQLTHKEHHLSRALFSSTFFPSICRLLPVPSNVKKPLTIIGTFSIWIDGVNFTPRVVDLSTTLLFFCFFSALLRRTVKYPDRNGSPKYISHKGFSWAIQIRDCKDQAISLRTKPISKWNIMFLIFLYYIYIIRHSYFFYTITKP